MNEAALAFWRGELEVEIGGIEVRAAPAKEDKDHLIRMRAQANQGKGNGNLAELTHLLSLNGMSLAQIAEIYRQQLLEFGLAILNFNPNAGMNLTVNQKNKDGTERKVFAAVSADTVVEQRQVEWTARFPTKEARDRTLQHFSSSTDGVYLSLASANLKLKEVFAVNMLAENNTKNTKREQNKENREGMETMFEQTFSVGIHSARKHGRFNRQEMEAFALKDTKSLTVQKLKRRIRALLSFDQVIADNIKGIATGRDAANGWDGSKITVHLRSLEAAQKLLRNADCLLREIHCTLALSPEGKNLESMQSTQ
eukprot:131444-Hanusia_phi.AAC.1